MARGLDLMLEYERDAAPANALNQVAVQLGRRIPTRLPYVEPVSEGAWQRSLPVRRVGLDIVVLALIAVLMFMFWPTKLGGATSYVLIKGTSMEPKFHTGDLAIVREQDHYKVGQIVAYRIPKGNQASGHLIIHRIVGHHRGGFLMQGDNRTTPDGWYPTQRDIVGRFRQLVPLPGIGFWMLIPWICAGFVGLGVMWIFWPRRVVEDPELSDEPADDESDPGLQTPVMVGDRRRRRLALEAERAKARAHRRGARRFVTR